MCFCTIPSTGHTSLSTALVQWHIDMVGVCRVLPDRSELTEVLSQRVAGGQGQCLVASVYDIFADFGNAGIDGVVEVFKHACLVGKAYIVSIDERSAHSLQYSNSLWYLKLCLNVLK